MPPRKDLGSILVDEQIIGAKDLERVERERQGDGRPLWAALLDGRLVGEDELFFVMAQRYGAPVMAEELIAEAKLPTAEVLRRALGREQALKAGLLPIDFQPDGQRLTVVMVDPSDETSLAALLTRAQVPEGRALLGRWSAIERAIERLYAPVGKLTPPHAVKAIPAAAPSPLKDDEPTGTVKLDPALKAEIARLPQRALKADALTPLPAQRPRPRRTTPEPESANRAEEPRPAANRTDEARPPAEDRFTRALLQAVEVLALELELRLAAAGGDEAGRVGRPGRAGEMARLARQVARQLNVGRRAAEEIGVAAQLYVVDVMMRQVDGGVSSELFGELGWPGATENGLVPILRALTAASAGFQRGASGSTPPLGARIIGVIGDYLELGAAAGEAELDTVSQLLRASSAGAPVVDALLRVLESEREDRTPKSRLTASPATSLLKEGDGDTTGEHSTGSSDEKTRKSAPSERHKRDPQE